MPNTLDVTSSTSMFRVVFESFSYTEQMKVSSDRENFSKYWRQILLFGVFLPNIFINRKWESVCFSGAYVKM